MAAPSSSPFHLHSAINSSLKTTAFATSRRPFRFNQRRSIFLSSPVSYSPSSSSSSSSSFFCCCSSTSTSKDSTPLSIKLKLDSLSESGIFIPVQKNSNEFDDDECSSNNALELLKNRSVIVKEDLGKNSFWDKFKKFRSIILLNAITIVYASNIPVVKEAEVYVHPEVFTAVRFVFAALVFLPFIIKAKDDSETRKAGLELGFWISLAYLMQALGLLTSDAGRASFISMFTVVVVPFLDGILGSIIPVYTWFGALTSLVGVGMLESSGSPPCVGDLLTFLSAVFFGVHMLRTERISRSVKKENFLALLGYEVCVVAFSSILWCTVEGCFGGTHELSTLPFTWTAIHSWIVAFPWIPALYTGIFSTGLCLYIEMSAMRDVSATETAMIYGMEPVWGAAFAWFLLGERWGAKGWIGAALVLGGSLVVQLCGLSSSSSSDEDTKLMNKNDDLMVMEKQNEISISPIVVSSSSDSSNLLKK